MASIEDFGLADFGQIRSSGNDENGQSRVRNRHLYMEEQEQVSLPRADGGREAWLFLAGCFCIEALTFGECVFFFVPECLRIICQV